MAAIIISSNTSYTFGAMSTRLVSSLVATNTGLERVKTAIASASAGTADDGTQFEVSGTTLGPPTTPPNLFGIVADPENPGQRGKDYQYAMNQLDSIWATFWEQAKPYIEQLDQGTTGNLL